MQMNPSGKVQLVFADVPRTSLFLSCIKTYMIFLRGTRSLMSTLLEFFILPICLASYGAILFFHSNDLRVLKEVKSYLESYGFQIWMKWVVANSLPLMNNEVPSLKVPSRSIKLYLHFSSFQL